MMIVFISGDQDPAIDMRHGVPDRSNRRGRIGGVVVGMRHGVTDRSNRRGRLGGVVGSIL